VWWRVNGALSTPGLVVTAAGGAAEWGIGERCQASQFEEEARDLMPRSDLVLMQLSPSSLMFSSQVDPCMFSGLGVEIWCLSHHSCKSEAHVGKCLYYKYLYRFLTF
jgi:hypothetical protein